MIKIIGERDTGKSAKLLQEAAKVNGTVICKHPYHAMERMQYLGITNVAVLSYEDFLDTVQKPSNIFIDDLDEFVNYFCTTYKDTPLQGFVIVND